MSPSPLMYTGDEEEDWVSSFRFKDILADLETPAAIGYGRLYYQSGWTGVILWDGSSYFADGFFLFDEMIELISTRYGRRFEFEIEREYEDGEEG